ncbi:MAG: hypothetical protein QM785_18220 [Pyrinomonadaceae bacterium]
MDRNAIAETFATYRKYGWIPRRLILTSSSKRALQGFEPDIAVFESDIDAAWFSRPPAAGKVAWELRYLGNTPFALLEEIDESGADLEVRLRSVEERLKAAIRSRSN